METGRTGSDILIKMMESGNPVLALLAIAFVLFALWMGIVALDAMITTSRAFVKRDYDTAVKCAGVACLIVYFFK